MPGENPNRNSENDADNDEIDGESYVDPSYSDNTRDDLYLHGQHSGPRRTNYG